MPNRIGHRVANAGRSLALTSSMQTQFAGAAHGIVPCRSMRAGSPDTEVSMRAPRRRRLTIVHDVFAEPPRERSVFGESARRAGYSTQQQRQLSDKLETCRHGGAFGQVENLPPRGRFRTSWKLAATGALSDKLKTCHHGGSTRPAEQDWASCHLRLATAGRWRGSGIVPGGLGREAYALRTRVLRLAQQRGEDFSQLCRLQWHPDHAATRVLLNVVGHIPLCGIDQKHGWDIT